MSTDSFNWPVQYTFPPFFTLQPNAETRTRQFRIWSDLIVQYCQTRRQFTISRTDEVFGNQEIKRKLNNEGVTALMKFMEGEGRLQFTDGDRGLVFWHSPQQWATIIEKYVQSNGLKNTVETFYELLRSKSEFQGMEPEMFKRCLALLQKEGKVELIGDDGVKFF